MFFDSATDSENETRERGQSRALKQSFENGSESRHDKYREQRHNCSGDEQHSDRIVESRLNLAFYFARLLHELSQPAKCHFQRTTQFTRLHHIDIERVENPWMG